MRYIILFFKNLALFFKGAFDFQNKATNHISNEADALDDQFFLLCFGDYLGLDLPTTYYALELLPYLGEDIEKWQKRMNSQKSIWEQKAGQLDMDP
jgi:hypothetical protein